MDEQELTDSYIKRLQNLGPYKGKTPDEIRELVKQKKAAGPKTNSTLKDKTYDEKFKERFDALRLEFGVDLNDSNDLDALNNLARLIIQSENIDKDIRAIQEKDSKTKDDVLVLKALGDFQRNLQMSISDIQVKLGINRQSRKEKAADDIPQWIDGVLKKSVEFWNRKTVPVLCPKCEIELVRYWLNFPDLTTIVKIEAECPHCGEIFKYNR